MSKIEVNAIEPQCGTTLTLGASGDTVTLAVGATQTGFGRTGTVDWDTTAKTTSFTAVSGNGYFVNTTSGAITVTLPAGSAGSIVSLKDYANTWNTNNVTVTPNGTDKINGINAYATLNTQDQSITLVYVDDTKGWRVVQDSTSDVTGAEFIVATGGTVTCCGDYKIHTFTGPGTFTVCTVANCASNNEVSYLVVAGGAAGQTKNSRTPGPSSRYGQPGGGAGGFRESKSGVDSYTSSPLEGSTPITVTATAFPITVGGGGSSPSIPSTDTHSGSGSNSVFSTITSTGGGGAGYHSVNDPTSQNGLPGGSGGGGSGQPSGGGGGVGGTGNTPPVSPAQGTNGGIGTSTADTAGGGGGGATGAGGNGIGGPSPRSNTGGAGGAGVTTSISASPTAYAGGGGGGAGYPNCGGGTITGGAGGTGGGGAGGDNSPSCGTSGTTNTGGGGGGAGGNGTCGSCAGGAGGSGIVIIRYKFQ
jgi:hypothetical protein